MFYCAKGTIGNDVMQLGVWGAVSSPAGPGQSRCGGPGGEAPEDLEILHFTVPRLGQETTPFTRVLYTRSEEELIKFRNLQKKN